MPALSGTAMTVQPDAVRIPAASLSFCSGACARAAQIRLAVGHGSRTQRQEGGSLCIQCLYAAQKLRDGGGVCAEHADAWKIVSLHSGHPLTKKSPRSGYDPILAETVIRPATLWHQNGIINRQTIRC